MTSPPIARPTKRSSAHSKSARSEIVAPTKAIPTGPPVARGPEFTPTKAIPTKALPIEAIPGVARAQQRSPYQRRPYLGHPGWCRRPVPVCRDLLGRMPSATNNKPSHPTSPDKSECSVRRLAHLFRRSAKQTGGTRGQSPLGTDRPGPEVASWSEPCARRAARCAAEGKCNAAASSLPPRAALRRRSIAELTRLLH